MVHWEGDKLKTIKTETVASNLNYMGIKNAFKKSLSIEIKQTLLLLSNQQRRSEPVWAVYIGGALAVNLFTLRLVRGRLFDCSLRIIIKA